MRKPVLFFSYFMLMMLFTLFFTTVATTHRYSPLEVKDSYKFNRIDTHNKYFYPQTISSGISYTLSYELGYGDGKLDAFEKKPMSPYRFQRYNLAEYKNIPFPSHQKTIHKKDYIKGYRLGYLKTRRSL